MAPPFQLIFFPGAFPRPLLAARSALFIVAALMLLFGIAPFWGRCRGEGMQTRGTDSYEEPLYVTRITDNPEIWA